MEKKVVLIQDNEQILEVMDHILTNEGYDVTPSLTTDPIKEIEDINPDVVIVDEYIKGDQTGTEVIEELKSDPATEDLSAVLTSTSPELSKKAEQCKADDYIEKPFDIDDLIDVVKKNT